MNQRTVPAAPKTPARAHKTYLVITRMLLWAVLLVWVLFALTLGALHLWIVPRIDDWRPDLERWASAAVGIPVKVGAIRAESVGDAKSQGGFVVRLVPAIELQDVRLYDPAGREALHLPSVHAAISVPSLWRLGFEQLLIEGPVLDIRRTPEGRIEIAGLDFSGPQNDEGRAADWFFSQTEFVIRNGTVRWTDKLRGQPTLALDTLSLVARNGLRSHLLRLEVLRPDGSATARHPSACAIRAGRGAPCAAAVDRPRASRPGDRRPPPSSAGRPPGPRGRARHRRRPRRRPGWRCSWPSTS